MKKNSLPEVKLSIVNSGDSIEKIFNIDEFELKKKLNFIFNNEVDVSKVFNKTTYKFSDELNDITLKTFLDTYKTFSDKEIMYMIWSYIDSQFRFSCLYQGNTEDA